MNNSDWVKFFTACNEVLGQGSCSSLHSENWCAWTTFGKLQEDCLYWRSGLPNNDELTDTYVKDGGTWGQPFLYSEIAHIIVPSRFYWERPPGKGWECGHREQNIAGLSQALQRLEVQHRITDIILEIKLY
ncbi:hypothetical protein [Spartinivicinus ruber]|uniref:hypothetical protein n=1 Tax=Spartinivicinus ruber TaxID=2683272 RepID=UPI0013D4646B|nr:hypothetical protein [Spartinivicinus ruber]